MNLPKTKNELALQPPEKMMKPQLKAIGQRLKLYMERRGLKVATLSHTTNLPEKQIDKIIDGEEYPVKYMVYLLKALQDINGRWLILGNGEMLKHNVPAVQLKPLSPIMDAKNGYNAAAFDADLLDQISKLIDVQKKVIRQNRKLLKSIRGLRKTLKTKKR